MTRGLVTVHVADVTPLIHAIERAALRFNRIPRDNLVGRLDVMLQEFGNILAAYVAYRDAAAAPVRPRKPEPQEFHTPKPTVLQ